MRVLVKDVMSRGVLKLKRNQTIKEVNQLFLDRSIDGAPVVDDTGKVVGVFTKTHLMRVLGKSMDTPIDALMNKNVMTINELMPVEEALNIPVGRLPVVDDDGRMVGWLTRTDLAKAFLDHYKRSIDSLSQLIDYAPHGILAVDVQGVITLVNKTGESLWGIESAQVLGRSAREVFPAVDFRRVLDSEKPVHTKTSVNGKQFLLDIVPIKPGRELKGALAEFYIPR